MAQKSFVTNMPDKAGAFLRASKIIADHGGNIVRVSYNRAVDPHMLFVDVQASENVLLEIQKGLSDIGYINENITEIRIIEVSVRIPDKPGAVLPVLEILNRYAINISYMNSSANNGEYQDFKFGLLIEKPEIIKILIYDISRIYQTDIIECDSAEENLDNTVFYIRLANEIRNILGINTEKAMLFISESNRMLQVLQSEGENAGKVFEYIRQFARFVSSYRGDNFKVNIQKLSLSSSLTLYSIQPYCGSNSYLLVSENDLIMIDTGYAIYTDEMKRVINDLLPDIDKLNKKIYITHADVDHCGMLSRLADYNIIVNQKSAENFKKQLDQLPDYREQTELHMGYSRISRIISDYMPPDLDRLTIFGSDVPEEHDLLLQIGNMQIGGFDFTIFEGSGGHLYGEMIYVCLEARIVFTGDIYVNIDGFSKERAEFNSLAPFLMKSVNVNSKKASEMRRQVFKVIRDISIQNNKPCIICGGHGPVAEFYNDEITDIYADPVKQ